VAGDFRTNQQDPELERRGAENRPGREYWAVVAPRVVVAMMRMHPARAAERILDSA